MLTVYHQHIPTLSCAINLSAVPSSDLVVHMESLLQHHAPCSVYLGYLEAGWMLDPKHEIRLRTLIRTFDVHMVCWWLDSLSFAWKNEIGIIYRRPSQPHHECSQVIHDGGVDHNQSSSPDQSIVGGTSDQ